MDNRLNELRRKISGMRLQMLDMEASIRDQVNNDRDCTDSALRLMAMTGVLGRVVPEALLPSALVSAAARVSRARANASCALLTTWSINP